MYTLKISSLCLQLNDTLNENRDIFPTFWGVLKSLKTVFNEAKGSEQDVRSLGLLFGLMERIGWLEAEKARKANIHPVWRAQSSQPSRSFFHVFCMFRFHGYFSLKKYTA